MRANPSLMGLPENLSETVLVMPGGTWISRPVAFLKSATTTDNGLLSISTSKVLDSACHTMEFVASAATARQFTVDPVNRQTKAKRLQKLNHFGKVFIGQERAQYGIRKTGTADVSWMFNLYYNTTLATRLLIVMPSRPHDFSP